MVQGNEAWRATAEATKDIPVATSEDLEWADAIIFSTPTRFGNMASQMKQFLDIQGGLWASGKTVNKVVSAMTSAQNPHGGQEATILSLYTSMMHWGAIIVPPGYSDPVIFGAGGESIWNERISRSRREYGRRCGSGCQVSSKTYSYSCTVG